MDEGVVGWLLEGDPAIIWQTMRDVQGAPESVWRPVRESVATTGWGARILDFVGDDGLWPEDKWQGSTWSLLTLIDLGIPHTDPRARAAAHRFLIPRMGDSRLDEPVTLFKRTSLFLTVDLCHLGFWLKIGSYFETDPAPLRRVAQIALELQMPDGGWNCRSQRLPKTRHSSFHTTFNILEGLRAAADAGHVSRERFRESEIRALEFMLAHHLYRSDRTGEMIDERFLRLTYPWRWHYRVLRGLDYFRTCSEFGDERLSDPLEALRSRRGANGRWPCESPISGKALFPMETPGHDSRWITLFASRILAGTENDGREQASSLRA